MRYKYPGNENLGGLDSSLPKIGDTRLGHVNLDAFWERIRKP